MSEAKLWSWLRDRLPLGHATRIESEVSEGFPDVHYTMKSRELSFHPEISMTIELKYCRGPKRQPLKDQVRQSQIIWIEDEVRMGGRVWIIVQLENTVYIIPGKYVAQLNFANRERLKELASLVLSTRKALPETVTGQLYETFRFR